MGMEKTWSVREELAQKAERTKPQWPAWKFRVSLWGGDPTAWKVEERLHDVDGLEIVAWPGVYATKDAAIVAVREELERRRVARVAQAERDKQTVLLDAEGHAYPSS
jgi:hypothetical protein